jgi:hypothetical protein
MVWTSFGWRKASGDDEPILYDYLVSAPTQGKDDRTAIKAWNAAYSAWYEEINRHAANARAEWEDRKCGQSLDTLPDPTLTPEAGLDVVGTYAATVTYAGILCVDDPPKELTVQAVGTDGIKLIIGTRSFDARLDPTFHRFSGTLPDGGSVQGTFRGQGENGVAIEGEIVIRAATDTCSITFTGSKTSG